jgi:hypothetical protein
VLYRWLRWFTDFWRDGIWALKDHGFEVFLKEVFDFSMMRNVSNFGKSAGSDDNFASWIGAWSSGFSGHRSPINRKMNLEGEYAVDKSQRAHRIVSGIVFAVWIGLAFYTRGMGQAFRTVAYYLLPMSCIWFPEVMATYTGALWGRGRFVDERSHPTFLRWGGWFLLLFVPLFLLILFFLNKWPPNKVNLDRRILSVTAFALFVCGVFAPFVPRFFGSGGLAFVFAIVSMSLALILGILGRIFLLGKVAAIGALIVCVIGTINYICFRYHADAAELRMEQQSKLWNEQQSSGWHKSQL